MLTKPRRNRHYTTSALLLSTGIVGLYLLFNFSTQLQPVLPPLAAQRNLQHWLIDNSDQLMQNEPLYHLATVAEIYQRTNYQLLWFKDYQLSEAGQQLLQQLLETSADELRDYHYHSTYLHQRLHHVQTLPREATGLDILLSDAFVSYAEDVLNDNLLPDIIEGNPFPRNPLLPSSLKPTAYQPPSITQAPILTGHIVHDDIIELIVDNPEPGMLKNVLQRMTPAHPEYHRLRTELNHFRSLLSNNQWQPLPQGPNLKKGDRHSQVAQLRHMLKNYNDYPNDSNTPDPHSKTPIKYSEYFDNNLQIALKKFQHRHGKKPSGILTPPTRKLLNINPSQRIKQLALNMKRWRQLPSQLGERYIWVNMTNYRLQLINNNQTELEMRVIVGKPYRQTPVLQEFIRTVVLNPTWNVPRRITLYDILPHAKKDPGYLSQRNISVFKSWSATEPIDLDQIDWDNASPKNFPYRLQQAAGDDNALGMVKFVIPNDLSIYLHDTNHRNLFKRDMRSLSSGCVRVEKPLELAYALLKGKTGWNKKRIQATLASKKTTYIRLPQNIPTYLMYWTAWVDKNGILNFRDDIYKHDLAHFRTPQDADSLIL